MKLATVSETLKNEASNLSALGTFPVRLGRSWRPGKEEEEGRNVGHGHDKQVSFSNKKFPLKTSTDDVKETSLHCLLVCFFQSFL